MNNKSWFAKPAGQVRVSPPAASRKGMPKLSASDWKDRLFNFSPRKQVLLVEVGDGIVKLAGFSAKKNERKLIAVASVASPPGGSEIDLSLKIRNFLKAHALKPNEVVVLHPSYNLTARILNLPSIDSREIRDILDLQAVKQTPHAREEITTGFRILDSDSTGYSRVLLVISHRDVASAYFRATDLSGFQATRIHVALDGLRAWYEGCRFHDPDRFDRPTVMLDLDWSSTEFMLFQRGKLWFQRNISSGVKQLMEQGTAGQTALLQEIQRSIDSCQAELKDEALAGMVVSGLSPQVAELVPYFSRELGIPVEAVSSLKPYESRISKNVVKSVAEVTCSLSGILGYAFDPDPALINLIPAQLEAKKSLEDRAKDLAILGTMFLALVILVASISFEKIFKKDQYVRLLQKNYDAVSAQAEEVERTLAKMKIAGEQMSAGSHFLDVLYDVTDVLPLELYLTSIQYQANDSALVIRGISEEMSSVFKLITTLEGTAHLEAVKTRNVTKRKVKDKELVEFEISGTVVNAVSEHAPENEAPQPS